MKKRYFKMKISTVIATILMVGAFSLGVMADDLRKEVLATEAKDMHLSYNGEEFMARDVNENVVYPIVINGTSYLPTRAVCDIAGLKVDWNGSTRTILLTSSDYVSTDNTGYSLETEINGTKEDANILPVDGGKFKGRVGEDLSTGYDEDDFYKFAVSEHGIVDIMITSDAESEMDALILNVDGDEIQGLYSVPADGIQHFRMPLLTGTYYLNLDADSSESAYRIDTSFKAMPDDYEDDYYITDVPGISYEGKPIVIEGAVGTYADAYADHYVIKDFDTTSYKVNFDWEGPKADTIYMYVYDDDGYYIDSVIDLTYDGSTYSAEGTTESNISYIEIYAVPYNDTSVCNEYTLTVSE